MNIFQAIEQDHFIQKKLLEKLVATSGDTEQRREIFEQLKSELAIHADAEERYFYVPLIEIDKTQDDARHGIAEHHEIEEMVETLLDTPFDSPAWLVHAKTLADKVKHHLQEEEQDYFPKAEKVLSKKQTQELADQYLNEMNDARKNNKD